MHLRRVLPVLRPVVVMTPYPEGGRTAKNGSISALRIRPSLAERIRRACFAACFAEASRTLSSCAVSSSCWCVVWMLVASVISASPPGGVPPGEDNAIRDPPMSYTSSNTMYNTLCSHEYPANTQHHPRHPPHQTAQGGTDPVARTRVRQHHSARPRRRLKHQPWVDRLPLWLKGSPAQRGDRARPGGLGRGDWQRHP